MDEESYSLNCCPLPPFIFEQPPSLEAIPHSQPLSTEISSPASNFLIETAIGSMGTSPLVSIPPPMPVSFMIRELFGKLGNVSPPEMRGAVTPLMGSCNTSATNSCYAIPPSSPYRIDFPTVDHLVKDHFSSLGNSIPLASTLPAMPGDPGFTDRPATLASFGSRSLNGLTGQVRPDKSSLLPYGGGTLPRVSSSPSSLKARIGNQLSNSSAQQLENHMSVPAAIDGKWSKLAGNCALGQPELANNSTDNSSRDPSKEDGFKHGNDANSRKRKVTPKGKVKQVSAAEPVSSSKKMTADGDDDHHQRAKRTKINEGNGEQRSIGNAEKDKDDDSKKHSDGNQKPCEPPKDYIHVRARRGQATDSHSLAERLRRERISERMKLLQDLVPGCNKVTGKALMLDEIINYVQSLQKQVEFLSMKLAAMNPRMEFNVDTFFTDKILQTSCSLPQENHHLDSPSTGAYRGQQSLPNPLQANTTNSIVPPSSTDPLQATNLNHDSGMKLPLTDGRNGDGSQLPPFFQDDLQTIVDIYGLRLK